MGIFRVNTILFNIGIVISLLAIFFFFDYMASMYGNGLYFKRYSLKYDMELSNVVGVQINYDNGFGYIYPRGEYITKDKQKIVVQKLLYYNETKDAFAVQIRDSSDKTLCLTFKSTEEVYDKTPEISYLADCMKGKSTRNVADLPIFFYYWRLIGFLIAVFIFLNGFFLVYSIVKLGMRKLSVKSKKTEKK